MLSPQITAVLLNISIHAPTKGATLYYASPSAYVQDFNPRTHEGCDLRLQQRQARQMHFNPRTHEGCDDYLLPIVQRDFIFQSTHPRRVRLLLLPVLWLLLHHFNPRTHEGCDMVSRPPSRKKSVFQSTHPRRVRPNVVAEISGDENISIHAPTKGATIPFIYRFSI
ncbi:MAG: hypothetical protein ACFWTM_03300 [Mitsuokella multacida]